MRNVGNENYRLAIILLCTKLTTYRGVCGRIAMHSFMLASLSRFI